MLMMPEAQQCLHKFGLASLGASEDDLEKLAAVYWYTFEIGLCKGENGATKILGGAVITSLDETAACLSPSAKLISLDIDEIITKYLHSIQYSGLQPFYVQSPPLQELFPQLEAWLEGFLQKKQFVPSYCEKTKSIKVELKRQ